MDEKQLQHALRIPSVRLLNDLDAIAHAIPFLETQDLHTLHEGQPISRAAIAVIAPGTGLCEAFLTWDGSSYQARTSEGGRASEDAVRSLVISEQLLGTTSVVVIHHTDCGMLTFRNEDLAAKLKQELQVDAYHIDFLPFADLEQSVRDDVAILKASPLIPKHVSISGFIYDVKSGRLLPVT